MDTIKKVIILTMIIVIEVIINKIKENKYTIIECSQLRENIFLTL